MRGGITVVGTKIGTKNIHHDCFMYYTFKNAFENVLLSGVKHYFFLQNHSNCLKP